MRKTLSKQMLPRRHTFRGFKIVRQELAPKATIEGVGHKNFDCVRACRHMTNGCDSRCVGCVGRQTKGQVSSRKTPSHRTVNKCNIPKSNIKNTKKEARRRAGALWGNGGVWIWAGAIAPFDTRASCVMMIYCFKSYSQYTRIVVQKRSSFIHAATIFEPDIHYLYPYFNSAMWPDVVHTFTRTVNTRTVVASMGQPHALYGAHS
ncbi:hypothetical protein BC830DRAFT_653811 [Chytriomyces sp. MP71]|nr:hypothetical protein BC830DRAFT_653811 [Chytriomyces sp. MP71]